MTFSRYCRLVMQSAAIPYRRTAAGIEVLLITSKTRRRWVLPKGKIAKGMLAHNSAAKEAMEEAGVIGAVETAPVAEYVQSKAIEGTPERITVRAFALAVESEIQRWPEDHQRKRRWLPLKAAIKLVDDAELRAVLKRFATLRDSYN